MGLGWYVIEPPTSGVIALQAKQLQAALVGKMPNAGMFSASLQKLSAAIAGNASPAGQLNGNLNDPFANFLGGQSIVANVVAALPKTSFAGTAQEIESGSVVATAQKANAALVGTVINYGGLIATAKKTQASFVGGQTIPGSIAATAQKLSALFADGTSIGSSVMTLAKATAALAGVNALTGTLVSNLPASASFNNGVQQPAGQVVSSLPIASAGLQGAQIVSSSSFIAALKIAQAAFVGGTAQAGGVVSSLPKATFAGASASTPVAYYGKDTLITGAVNPGPTYTYSGNLTIPAGMGAVVLAFDGTINGLSPASETVTATLNGTAMTLIQRLNLTTDNFIAVFAVLAPPSGSIPLVITLTSGSSTLKQIVGNAYYYQNVSGFGTPTTVVQNAATTPHTITGPTGLASGDIPFCIIGGFQNNTWPFGQSHTPLDNSSSGGFYSNVLTYNGASGANSVPFAGTPNSSAKYTACAFAIKA